MSTFNLLIRQIKKSRQIIGVQLNKFQQVNIISSQHTNQGTEHDLPAQKSPLMKG